MKKAIFFAALTMGAVLFTFTACQEKDPVQASIKKAVKAGYTPYDAEFPYPILPAGPGVSIPDWKVSEDGVKGLPAVITDLALGDGPEFTVKTNVTPELKKAVEEAAKNNLFKDRPVKNAIVMIGDGMGASHIKISRQYKGELILDSIPNQMQSKTKSYKNSQFQDDKTGFTTTDSSAGGTAILSGYKTRYGYIGVDREANPVKTFGELGREMNKIVGVVTNDHFADATPACAIVHNTSRYHQSQIYMQELLFGPDLIMGTDWGLGAYFQDGVQLHDAIMRAEYESIMSDATVQESKTLPKIPAATDSYEQAVDSYYAGLSDEQKEVAYKYSLRHYLHDRFAPKTDYDTWCKSPNGLKAWEKATLSNMSSNTLNVNDFNYRRFTTFGDLVKAGTEGNLIGSWEHEAAWMINKKKKPSNDGYNLHSKTEPNFPEMVKYALSTLQAKAEADPNSDGFVVMIENTCTDGWGHSQLPLATINEIQCFDEGVAVALKFVLENPDTILVISADHETGDYQTREGWETNFDAVKSASGGHSTQKVNTYGFGPGTEIFTGENENDKTGQFIGRLLGDSSFGNVNGYAE